MTLHDLGCIIYLRVNSLSHHFIVILSRCGYILQMCIYLSACVLSYWTPIPFKSFRLSQNFTSTQFNSIRGPDGPTNKCRHQRIKHQQSSLLHYYTRENDDNSGASFYGVVVFCSNCQFDSAPAYLCNKSFRLAAKPSCHALLRIALRFHCNANSRALQRQACNVAERSYAQLE